MIRRRKYRPTGSSGPASVPFAGQSLRLQGLHPASFPGPPLLPGVAGHLKTHVASGRFIPTMEALYPKTVALDTGFRAPRHPIAELCHVVRTYPKTRPCRPFLSAGRDFVLRLPSGRALARSPLPSARICDPFCHNSTRVCIQGTCTPMPGVPSLRGVHAATRLEQ